MDMPFHDRSQEYADPTAGRRGPGAVRLRAYWSVFWANFALGMFQLAAGAAGYGPVLIVDGLTSAAIAAVATTILFGLYLSRPDAATREYPYGKGKLQYLSALTLGALLAAAAAAMLALSIVRFFGEIETGPVAIALAVACVSLLSNVALLIYLRRLPFPASSADARSLVRLQWLAVVASLVTIQSLVLSGLAGWFLPERMGTLTLCLIVMWLSVRIIRRALEGVMDRSGGFEPIVVALARSLDEVEGVESVRTRNIGHALSVHVVLRVAGDLTVQQGDRIAARFRKHLAAELEGLDYGIDVACCAA